ncbi:phosphohydrolase [Cohnella sp. CIP 111063]|uniref:HD-GYP domain-containing protein n=1 Tax=unclassified Cohnella TaxID=2636738 RepID=UPI000B8BE6E1|nr:MULTISPECIES: HD-GYP domain-containing protein [unclassified Cohnella]OXS59238.1 phosphohydrolase [Cohnella sp. CIP 111063]PRX72252.1 HD-GYP domain-containing protein (c-di-GMP phosphodiesterase class II) [Cohnella sp. SGD-V74]
MEHLIGRRVLADVINNYGVTIIPAQTVLNYDSVKLLYNHKIDEFTLSLDQPPESQGDGARSRKVLKQTVSRSKELFSSVTDSGSIPLADIRREILPAIRDLSGNSDLFELFEIVKAKDDYTYEHNIGVGILATLIGGWMNLSEDELAILSLAATLHDIGKVNVPESILNKPGSLTDEEFEIVKKHTVHGYELLKNAEGLHPRVALVALQHHEREDGRGYPHGLDKSRIDPFSAIVAVADIFHAMSSKRPYREATPFHEIVSQMRQGKFGELNPQIVSLFLDNLMKKLLGRHVVLTDGRAAEVVYLNPHNMESPLVKAGEQFIDLAKERNVQIREIALV